jgi:hypothetical protein
MWFSTESKIERLTAEFAEGKAQIWAAADMPLQDKGPAVEQLWREFNRQRHEIRSSASQGEATGEEHQSPGRSRAPFLPRRRMPRWK